MLHLFTFSHMMGDGADDRTFMIKFLNHSIVILFDVMLCIWSLCLCLGLGIQ
jgi:heme/copper-type cytochrome/quinol oxidase subunit 4